MPASPSDTLRIWFERLWNAGDESVIDELYAPTAMVHGLPGTLEPGPAGFKPFYRAFRAAFPDIHVEITHAVSEGELGIVRCRVTGLNAGPLMNMAATHKSVDFTGMTMARVADGRILEAWNEFNFIDMYQQLGMQPPQPA
jgi:predicted ester cyclase